ncbi:MAG: c-type cytochrome [Thermoleophilaceae bacterium]|nr:c-type cytochrome [Thermoleophilaceae bacterium]
MSLLRTPFKPLLAALAAIAIVAFTACGREEDDLSNGKAQFVQKCGSCHELGRAGTQGQTGPSLDAAFRAALADGMNRDTIEGVVHRQIGNVRRNSKMPADLVTGDDARDVAAYVAYATGKTGEDTGALAQAGLSGATTGAQIFTAAGCGGCHQLSEAGTNGNIGPSLNELASAAGEREPGQSASEYVHESIVDPDAVTVSGYNAGVMPSYEGKLTEKQLDALVQYLLGG